MAKTCTNCEIECRNGKITMTEWAYEAQEARHERQLKRLWIALIVAMAVLFASNMGWLIYQSQYETFTYEQTGEGINNVNYGEQGDLNNGSESSNQAEEVGQGEGR